MCLLQKTGILVTNFWKQKVEKLKPVTITPGPELCLLKQSPENVCVQTKSDLYI